MQREQLVEMMNSAVYSNGVAEILDALLEAVRVHAAANRAAPGRGEVAEWAVLLTAIEKA